MATPDVSVKITADASGFTRAVQIAQGAIQKLGAEMASIQAMSSKGFAFMGINGLTLSATAAAAAVLTLTKNAADYGDQLDNMSQRTGIAVEELAKLQYAAKLSDTSSEALQKGVTTLSSMMVAAASGADASSKLFEKYGIAVRKADGSIKSSTEVLYELADLFATMPDGVEKTSMATEFFGKKMGVELIPLLNQGGAALKAMGDEAERLGLVLSKEQAAAAAEFNDNLDRMSAAAGSLGKSIGNELIPVMNTFMQKLLLARDNKLSIGQILFDVLPKQTASTAEQIASVSASLDKLNAKRDALISENAKTGAGVDTSGIEKDIARQEAFLNYLNAQNKKQEVDDKAQADKRVLLQAQLVRKMGELEKLRAIAAGEASADILKSDKDSMAARLKDAEALQKALRAAYEESAKDAKKAAEEAVKLLDKAREKRTGAEDKAADMQMGGMSEEEKAAAAWQRAQELFDQGRYYAAAAANAQLDGRTKDMENFAKQADEFLSRAEGFAGKSGDPSMVKNVAESQARILESQAKAKQAEADNLNQRAADQMTTLADVEAKINDIKTAAANIQINADLRQLESDVARIKAEIEKGAVMPVTIAVGGGNINPDAGASGSFASGGWTGPGGKYQVAGVVHADEFVHRQEVVRQPGALQFLNLFNRIGMAALRGYADGGLVTSLAVPSAPSGLPARSALYGNFYIDGKAHQVQATRQTFDALASHFSREALRKGGR